MPRRRAVALADAVAFVKAKLGRMTAALAPRASAAPAAAAALAAPLAGAVAPARAGAQVEEPLADAVRSALSAAVADSAPPKPRVRQHRRAPRLPALARRR